MPDMNQYLSNLPEELARLKDYWQNASSDSDIQNLVRVEPIIKNRSLLQKLIMSYYFEIGYLDKVYMIEEEGILCPLLTNKKWIPSTLLHLGQIKAVWEDSNPVVQPLWKGLRKKLKDECSLEIIPNVTYRLLDIDIGMSNESLILHFTNATYEEYYETCEALTWELGYVLTEIFENRTGSVDMKNFSIENIMNELQSRLFRRNSVKPFDFLSRSMTPGINTLTIIAYRELTPIFLMHHRIAEREKEKK